MSTILDKIKSSIITNAQMEALLQTIPAGWALSFVRPTLRPDIIECRVTRKDGLTMAVKTTGAILLENPEQNFLVEIVRVVSDLSKIKQPAKKG